MPRRSIRLLLAFAATGVLVATPQAQAPPQQPASAPQPPAGAPQGGETPRPRMNRPVTLGPDDVPAFPEPPASVFDRREAIPHGTIELIEDDSKTVGTRRKMNVYTPPGYSRQQTYPVAYLLHGIGGDETEWIRVANPADLFDNLIADGKMVPFIAVFPNGRAQKNDRAEGNVFASAPAFAVFERDLFDDVIPAIEGRYAVKKERESRALAGLSMGGGQTLNFGLTHLDCFGWIGAFSSAPNTRPAAELLPDPAAARQLKLLFLSCGKKDGLMDVSQRMHAYLKEHGVPHVWHVDEHAHDAAHWRASLHHFAQRLFR